MTTLEMEHVIIDGHAQDILFREARTANTFVDGDIGDQQIQAVYDLVKWAPTSFNQQPLRIMLVRTNQARERLVGHMVDNNKAKTAGAPLTAILAADLNFHDHLPTQFPAFPQAKDFLFADPAVREESARLNASLQIGYFILGIRAIGLAAGPMVGFDAHGVTADFFPNGGHTALVVVNIGKPGPSAWYPRGPRLEYDQVVSTV